MEATAGTVESNSETGDCGLCWHNEDAGGLAGWTIGNDQKFWDRVTGMSGGDVWSTPRFGVYGKQANGPPTFPDTTPATLAVDENSVGGTAVGTVAATDDDGDTLTYTLDSASGRRVRHRRRRRHHRAAQCHPQPRVHVVL